MDIAENRTLEVVHPKTTANRAKFLIGGLLIVAAVLYLIFTSMQSSSQYFLTIKELQAKGSAIVGRDVSSPALSSATPSCMIHRL
jgi:hypothetical protein